VATMLTHNIKTIATDNEKHFRKFKEIKVFNPFEE
jgi:predicted nucleic acid-binding protein